MRKFTAVAKASISAVFLAASSYAQLPISIGVKGGVGLTDAFQSTTVTGISTFVINPGAGVATITNTLHTYSNSKDYIVGPFVELHLPFGFGAEFDGLYRPLNLAVSSAPSNGQNSSASQSFGSWEVSALGKYRFRHVPVLKPFLFVGPSFRITASNSNGSLVSPNGINFLSTAGISVGGGLELKLLFLRIAPELRYIHWGSDSSTTFPSFTSPSALFRSNQNQVELLLGISL
jgi:hypothetical protein